MKFLWKTVWDSHFLCGANVGAGLISLASGGSVWVWGLNAVVAAFLFFVILGDEL